MRRWNWQLHNSYFVIAHFHYVLVGAIVFCIFAAIYYWYPKVTGRMMSETLGKWHFWLFLIGFHITFDTMHFVGFMGMPRSIYTYEADRGWNTLNLIISIGGMHSGHRACSSLRGTSFTRISAAKRRATIRGTRGRSSGPRPRRRLSITLPPIRWCTAAGRCGI